MGSPVDHKSAAEIKAALDNNNLSLAAIKVKEYLNKVRNTPLNIGITGESGSGKSSFVNAFRGIDNKDKRAAPTGCVETTSVVTAYPHPSYPNVTLWDLPGIGTTRFPADKYLRHVGFEKFDFFIICSDTRFRENDVRLAQEIQKMGKKFYFVRSKIDNDLRAAVRSQRNFNAEELLRTIRQNCAQGLRTGGIRSPQVFLLSNFEVHLHDFQNLQTTLERELPDHRRHAVLHEMHNISRKIINKKKDAFRDKITQYAWISAAGAAVPLPGLSVAVDASLIISAVNDYKVGFGLNDPSLKRLSDTADVPLRELKAATSSPLVLENITPDLILKLLLQCAGVAALMAAEEGLSFIPFFGAIVAAPLSYKVTQRALENFLDILAADAQKVFDKVLDSFT